MRAILVLGIFLNSLGKLNGCVYLTVSPLPRNKLDVNWSCNETLQWISVYNRDPRINSDAKPLIKFSTVDNFNGYRKTNITFDPEPFPGGWSRYEADSEKDTTNDLCLYWILSEFQQDGLNHFDCFEIRPAWMSKHKMKLKHLSLPKLFIPGTHNSGADNMKTARKKRGIGHLDNFVLTQDQSIWNQLVYGIRFLDLRIGYYPKENDSDSRFWINHDLLRIQPLLPALKDIVRFSRESPDEIIILDFHRFPAGFQGENSAIVHRELLELIGREVKWRAIPRPRSQTELKLEQIWKSDKRIVVSYSEDNFVWETPWLWSRVSQKWGNKQTAEDLEKFLDRIFTDVNSRKLWAAMAELTPTPMDFLSAGSLRSMAENVNRLLSNWFAERRNWTGSANIVAPDFFLGTNLISIAIEENLRRANSQMEP